MAAPKKSRKSPRAQVSLVARYRSPTAFEFVQEECFDLSLGGMFIRSPAPAPAGTLIKLECDVNGHSGSIKGVARVVWLREHGADNQPAGMGVKFVKLDAGAREAIASVLEQLGTDIEERDTYRPPSATDAISVAPAGEGAASGPFQATPSARPGETAARQAVATPVPAPAATAVARSPAVARGDTKKAKDKSKKASTTTAATAKPAKSNAKRESVATLPPAHTRSRARMIVGAVALVAAIALFVVLSSQSSQEPADEVEPSATASQAPMPATTPNIAPEPPAPAAAPTPTPAPATPPPRYVLEVATTPPGARISAGGQALIAPGEFDLGQLEQPIALSVESDGFEPATATVDRVGFLLEGGAMRRRIELTLIARALPVRPAPVAEAPRSKRSSAASSKRSSAAVEPKAKPARPAQTPATAVETAAPAPIEAAAPEQAPPALATPTPTPAEPVAAAEPEKPAEEPAEPELTPLQAAAMCLTTGDNACVIRALEGKARSPRELELLIETYRATGQTPKAEKWMQVYLDLYPTERRAVTYRRMLDRRQDETAPPP